MADIHGGKRTLENQVRLVEEQVEGQNRNLILRFNDYLLSQGLSPLRIMRYLQILRLTSFWVDKPLEEWEENEIVKVLGELQKKGYKVGTLNEYRKAFKKFFKWLHREDWKHLKLLKRIKEKKNNPEVLSEEEAYKMIDAATNLRDKAMIAVAYEGGFRIGELGSLRIGDITFIQGRDGGLRAKANIRKVPRRAEDQFY